MHAWFIPVGGHHLIYRPLHKLAFVGNAALVDYLRARAESPPAVEARPDVETFLASVGYWDAIEPPAAPPRPARKPRASVAVLLMTNRCNLACTYCYASAGTGPFHDLPWQLARRVIETAAANAVANGEDRFALSFHGGGEPTVHWRVLTEAVALARAQPVPCTISLASNGVWTPAQCEFICANIDMVTLSIDGLPEVHDAQRRRRDGSGSHADVLRSIHALEEAGVSYGLRMTTAPDAIDRIAAGVRHLCAATRTRAIQVEMSFTQARGDYCDPAPEDARRFAAAFVEAARAGAQAGVFVYYSGARPWVLANTFCQAPSQAIIVNPDGRLVTCFEATGSAHPYAEEFTIGRVTADAVICDAAAVARFEAWQQQRRAACTECFCVWHCCGDCASRAMASPAPGSMRCVVNREITQALILDYVQQGKGVWFDRPRPQPVRAESPCPSC